VFLHFEVDGLNDFMCSIAFYRFFKFLLVFVRFWKFFESKHAPVDAQKKLSKVHKLQRYRVFAKCFLFNISCRLCS